MKDYLKKNKLLSEIVFWGMRIFMFLVSLFIKENKKQILFTSYTGRQYSDSPKVIYEKIKHDTEFEEYKLIWAFENPDSYPDIENKVAINSFKFLKILLKSKYWVANTSIERLSGFKPKSKVYIQTWHGVPLKFLGMDEKSGDSLVKKWYSNVQFDFLFSTGKYNTDILRRIFPNSKNSIREIGLPRNNELLIATNDENIRIKEKLGIELDKKVILYAPTFREYKKEKSVPFPFSEDQIEKLSEKYVILNRGHYFLKSVDAGNNDVLDVTNYSDLNDLLKISDGLVTDYSSIMFDYAILNRPIMLLVDDLEEYKQKRGLYIDVEELGYSTFYKENDLFEYLLNNTLPNKISYSGLGKQVVGIDNIKVLKQFILGKN
ncbi:CDP-glycerol glycerophosphotransferase family protein [Latilactobacillus curvatus]|uniref:CDP-glycerol glycerophosphotransferase family protein n=1 Tax=Latilactobacillus curvatus TaxID=28038 RepID=UPI000FECA218|nr:CDP-glycerol glycerophosphotransferase family protein [Latilactobacillus curvatus]QAR35028.1 CDP-glycerol--glycerophosphate glycerophosphotransferase [Latilactobacillus curvatus]